MKSPFILLFSLALISATALSQDWKVVEQQTHPEKRHENSMAAVDGKLYLVGGRGIKPVDQYDPKTNTWSKLAPTPIEINHFQAVTFKNEIYVLGAFTGKYPHETPIPNIYIFNPKKNEWRVGDAIPADRLRGAAGAFVYNNRIYIICGEQDGHWDGQVSWFDEYDPATGKWTKLPDAPRTRDHVSAVVLGDKLYIAGGRLSTARINQVLNTVIKEFDLYDFKTGKWSTMDPSLNFPTLRAGASAIVYRNKIVWIGGESDAHVEAHNEAEAFNPKTGKWETMPPLKQGRHGMSAVVINNKIYVVAGSANRGGGPELDEMEVFGEK